MVGEIVDCPECGLELEVTSVEAGKIVFHPLALVKEDWGE
jgi:lysine biosynthesis protein LysW